MAFDTPPQTQLQVQVCKGAVQAANATDPRLRDHASPVESWDSILDEVEYWSSVSHNASGISCLFAVIVVSCTIITRCYLNSQLSRDSQPRPSACPVFTSDFKAMSIHPAGHHLKGGGSFHWRAFSPGFNGPLSRPQNLENFPIRD